MLKTQISKLKLIYTMAYVPRIFWNDTRYSTELLKQLSICAQRKENKSTSCNKDDKHDINEERTRCQRIIDKVFAPHKPFSSIIETETQSKKHVTYMVTKELGKQCEKENARKSKDFKKILNKKLFKQVFISKQEPTVEKQCEKCQMMINDGIQIFRNNAKDKTRNGADLIGIQVQKLQATTAKEDPESLAQKIESVDETPLVEAPAKPNIEGFNTQPKVLGKSQKSESPELVMFASQRSRRRGKGSDERKRKLKNVDEIAKRCLDARNSKIDERILEEMEKLGISLSNRRSSGRVANDSRIIQPEIMRKTRTPSATTELDFVTTKPDEFEIKTSSLSPPNKLTHTETNTKENYLLLERLPPHLLNEYILEYTADERVKALSKDKRGEDLNKKTLHQQLLRHITGVISDNPNSIWDKVDETGHIIVNQESSNSKRIRKTSRVFQLKDIIKGSRTGNIPLSLLKEQEQHETTVNSNLDVPNEALQQSSDYSMLDTLMKSRIEYLTQKNIQRLHPRDELNVLISATSPVIDRGVMKVLHDAKVDKNFQNLDTEKVMEEKPEQYNQEDLNVTSKQTFPSTNGPAIDRGAMKESNDYEVDRTFQNLHTKNFMEEKQEQYLEEDLNVTSKQNFRSNTGPVISRGAMKESNDAEVDKTFQNLHTKNFMEEKPKQYHGEDLNVTSKQKIPSTTGPVINRGDMKESNDAEVDETFQNLHTKNFMEEKQEQYLEEDLNVTSKQKFPCNTGPVINRGAIRELNNAEVDETFQNLDTKNFMEEKPEQFHEDDLNVTSKQKFPSTSRSVIDRGAMKESKDAEVDKTFQSLNTKNVIEEKPEQYHEEDLNVTSKQKFSSNTGPVIDRGAMKESKDAEVDKTLQSLDTTNVMEEKQYHEEDLNVTSKQTFPRMEPKVSIEERTKVKPHTTAQQALFQINLPNQRMVTPHNLVEELSRKDMSKETEIRDVVNDFTDQDQVNSNAVNSVKSKVKSVENKPRYLIENAMVAKENNLQNKTKPKKHFDDNKSAMDSKKYQGDVGKSLNSEEHRPVSRYSECRPLNEYDSEEPVIAVEMGRSFPPLESPSKEDLGCILNKDPLRPDTIARDTIMTPLLDKGIAHVTDQKFESNISTLNAQVPEINNKSVPLSEMLKRVRERNRLQESDARERHRLEMTGPKQPPCPPQYPPPCPRKPRPKQDPCTPKPAQNPAKPKQDPCKPKCLAQSAICPAPQESCPSTSEQDPCKPKKDPCKPKGPPPCPLREDLCKPKQDPCQPKQDPCQPKQDPCQPKQDPCQPKQDPCKPNKCSPKQDPCKSNCSNVKILDVLSLLLYLGPQFNIPLKCIPFLVSIIHDLNKSRSSNFAEPNFNYQKLYCLVITAKALESDKPNSNSFAHLLNLQKWFSFFSKAFNNRNKDVIEPTGSKVICVKPYEPWTPIPSWPVPLKQKNKKVLFPKDGCKNPPPKLSDPCKENPCINFPKKHFSGIDILSLFGNKETTNAAVL